jgi:hypothetical protein
MGFTKKWYVVDGWLPPSGETEDAGYESHEALIILNHHDVDAHLSMTVYFEDREPIRAIPLAVPANRVKCFRTDRPEQIGGVILGRQVQYAIQIEGNVDVVVQFGRMDVTQSNLAYIGVMGHSSP